VGQKIGSMTPVRYQPLHRSLCISGLEQDRCRPQAFSLIERHGDEADGEQIPLRQEIRPERGRE